jgi:anti-sigma B factor antagonist
MSPHSAILIDAAYDAEDYVVRIQGELDLATCLELEHALVQAEAARPPRISLDLAQLTFIDSAGLYVLLSARRRSAANGVQLRMKHGKGQVARMFRHTGAETALTFTTLV